MSSLSERIVTALDANKGVLLPAIQALMEEAWNEGGEAAIEREHTYGREEKAKFSNPYTPTPPQVQTPEQIAAFARRWDARVEAGWRA